MDHKWQEEKQKNRNWCLSHGLSQFRTLKPQFQANFPRPNQHSHDSKSIKDIIRLSPLLPFSISHSQFLNLANVFDLAWFCWNVALTAPACIWCSSHSPNLCEGIEKRKREKRSRRLNTKHYAMSTLISATISHISQYFAVKTTRLHSI
jgi:hypothetical protein